MWDIDVRGILLHPTEAKAWLTPGPQAYRLPGFTFTHPEDPFLPNQLEGAWFPGLQNVYGCLLYVMGHVAEWKDSKSRRARVVCVLGIREGCPTRGEWVDIGAVSSGSFAVSEHGGLVRRTLSGLAEGSDEPALEPDHCQSHPLCVEGGCVFPFLYPLKARKPVFVQHRGQPVR